jgi:hypothetical protein
MKSQVTSKPTSGEFPKLMIDPSDGEIILFYREKYGVTVFPGSSDACLGEHRDDMNMSRFEDFKGEVTVSNN